MANYEAVSRTNYFRVTDEEKYNELFKNLVGLESEICDFTFTKEEKGITLHGFGSYGPISYRVPNSNTDEDYDDEDYDFDQFLAELQAILPENEAFIYMEAGNEKLRYITGFSVVVTKNDIASVDIRSAALEIAKRLLNDKKFDTQMEY